MTKRKKIEYTVCSILALIVVIFLFRNKLPHKVQRILGFSSFHTHSFPRELDYQWIQAQVLAEKLIENYSGNGACLLIHHVVSERGMSGIRLIERGLKKGFGDKVKDIYLAPIKNIDMNAPIIPEEVMEELTALDFNKVISAHPYCDLIVTLVPLPFNEKELESINIFKTIRDPENPDQRIKDPKQKYPTLGVFNGYVGNLESLFKDDLIQAMTLWRPNPTIDENPVPKDPVEAFKKRYIYITPDNLSEIKQKYPTLFPKPRKVKR